LEDPIIVVRGITKTYRNGKLRVEALKGIDLEVAQGEMVAVMGPSGCGKTTLLNCLSGLDDLDDGEIYIEGQKLHSLTDDLRTDYRARRMGFVFQHYNLLPVLTSVENVELPLLLSGTGSRRARELAQEMLEMVGLQDRMNHIPAELSGGQRQRVTIARALVNQPAIVWADEPTGDLDTETSKEIMNLVIKLNETNRQTFIMVTHSPDVGMMAHRIIRMRDGVIVDSDASKT
jgi:putative ABC transport system ATP-binding protein